MYDVCADIFLATIQTPAVLLVLISGFFLVNRPVFFQAMILCVLDMIVNVALKGIFKVPLSPLLHKIGYAFPSGHMQLASVFYLWLLWSIPNRLGRFVCVMMLFGIGCGLVHYDYHTVSDVLAGLISGICLIGLFRYGLLTSGNRLPWILMVCASLLMIGNGFLYPHIPEHATVAYALLSGLIIMERFFANNESHFWRIARFF